MRKTLFSFVVLAVCVGVLWTRMSAAQENRRGGGLPQCEANLNTCNADLAECINAPQSLLATGQTIVFQADKNNGFGFDDVPDDGTLQLGIPLSYTVSGDGLTITDNNTGLMWERKVAGRGCLHCDDDRYKWSGDGTEETIWDWLDDVNAEGGTGYAGYNDWRIPNVRELLSIVDYGKNRTTIHPDFGPTRDQYWTSTSPDEPSADLTFEVEFGQGLMKRFSRGSALQIRAVRGP